MLAACAYLVPAVAFAGPCAKGQDEKEHEIKSGQTLSHVAVKYGTSVKAIVKANPGLKPDKVRVGQKLTICTGEPKTGGKSSSGSSSSGKKTGNTGKSCGGGGRLYRHEVERGDTLYGIADQYGVEQKYILRRNPELKNDPSKLRVGQLLSICAVPRRAKASKACGMRSPLHKHEVVPGEYASTIAGRYGVRRKDLYRLNPKLKANPNKLSVGSRVLVCPEIAPRQRTKLTHAVQSGENIASIARKYDLTSRELIAYQQGRLKNPSSLRVGQDLVVWKDGGIVSGYGSYEDFDGKLPTGTQLPPGRHYVVKHPSLSWGTAKTVRLIQKAILAYRSKHGGPKVHVGDISKRGGGKFPPHRSHQTGHDVDVGYVLTGSQKDETRFVSANRRNMDVARTWRLLQAFLDTDEVRYIFVDYSLQKPLYDYAKERGFSDDYLDEVFQYPRSKRRTHGKIRHWKGHVNHFHVRFYK